MCLSKYISVKLLHDSTGLPYMKDRLFSCAITLLVCLSQDAPRVSQAIGSLRNHSSISYFWLNSLTFNPETIILRKRERKKQKGTKKHKKKKNQKYIYANTENQSNI